MSDLQALAIPAQTIEQVIRRGFDEDWNFRRATAAALDDDMVTVSVTFTCRMSAKMAKEVYAKVRQEEKDSGHA
ncbi:MAG TPA: hypothetical protein VF681_05770 [Abditibacteriaceae bacterium]|jgi:hypothetical protein